MKDSLAITAKPDPTREKHEMEIAKRLEAERSNPLQRTGDALVAGLSYVYSEYLYSTGTALLFFSLWAFYPSFARYRHKNVFRYRKRELEFKRVFFRTQHLPTWNKKYMQRIVVPPSRQPRVAPVERQRADSSDGATRTELASALPNAAALDPRVSDHMSDFLKKGITVRSTVQNRFYRHEETRWEEDLATRLQEINDEYFGDPNKHFDVDGHYNKDVPMGLREDIEKAVENSPLVCVLRESHDTVKSIPEGWEVWWMSSDEARRRSFCRFWITTLLVFRALQDLFFVPDMPVPNFG